MAGTLLDFKWQRRPVCPAWLPVWPGGGNRCELDRTDRNRDAYH